MNEEAGPQAPDSSLGMVLQKRREERGVSIVQASAATRVRAAHLVAIEDGHLDRLPAPVYARGYVRSYATYLGLDPEPLVAMLPGPGSGQRQSLALGGSAPPTRVVFTAPFAAAVCAVVVVSALGLYAWRQIESVSTPAGPSGHPAALVVVPSTTLLPSPSPTPRPMVVVVRVTDTVWVSVIVDGQSQYSDSGRILQPGTTVYFTGFDIKITSGKAAATFITIDDRPIGAMGNGVVTREFKASQ
jgi:hypothetical protein